MTFDHQGNVMSATTVTSLPGICALMTIFTCVSILQLTLKKSAKNAVFRVFWVFSDENPHFLHKHRLSLYEEPR